jgi:hypothetical protein
MKRAATSWEICESLDWEQLSKVAEERRVGGVCSSPSLFGIDRKQLAKAKAVGSAARGKTRRGCYSLLR